MKSKARGIAVVLAALLFLALPSIAALAQTPAKSIKEQMIGHWKLVSVMINDNAPYGGTPQGSMFLDAEGNFSVIVISAGKARNISYFGTFTVDDSASTITMEVVASNHPIVEARLTRKVAFKDDDLVISSEAPSGPAGAIGHIVMTWKQNK